MKQSKSMPFRQKSGSHAVPRISKDQIHYPDLLHLHSRGPSSSTTGTDSVEGPSNISHDPLGMRSQYSRDEPLAHNSFLNRKVDHSKLPPPNPNFTLSGHISQSARPQVASNTVAFPNEKELPPKYARSPEHVQGIATTGQVPLHSQPAVRRTASSGNLVYHSMNPRAAASTGNLSRSARHQDIAPPPPLPYMAQAKFSRGHPHLNSNAPKPDPLYFPPPSLPSGALETHNLKKGTSPARAQGYPTPELQGHVIHSNVNDTTTTDNEDSQSPSLHQSLTPRTVTVNPADVHRASWKAEVEGVPLDDFCGQDIPILVPGLILPPLPPSMSHPGDHTRPTRVRGPRENTSRSRR